MMGDNYFEWFGIDFIDMGGQFKITAIPVSKQTLTVIIYKKNNENNGR